MNVFLERVSGKFHLKGINEDGRFVETDASPEEGGTDRGVRPMQMTLMSFGSCSSIDVIMILEKMRQEVRDIKIELKAERALDETPSVFTKIHAHYKLWGDIDEKKAARAVMLSNEKYCSVGIMLQRAGVEITHSFEVIK